MNSRASLALSVALVASLAANLWLAARAKPTASGDAQRSAPVGQTTATATANSTTTTTTTTATTPDAATPDSDLPAIAKLLAAAAAQRAPRLRDDASEAGGAVRVDDAMLADIRCRIALERAARSFRDETEGIQRALLASFDEDDRLRRARKHRDDLAAVLGVDENDPRVDKAASTMVQSEIEARAELRRLMGSEPVDWAAATEVVAGLYREQNAAVHTQFGKDAMEEMRLANVDERATILAIGSSLANKPWTTWNDVTPRPRSPD